MDGSSAYFDRAKKMAHFSLKMGRTIVKHLCFYQGGPTGIPFVSSKGETLWLCVPAFRLVCPYLGLEINVGRKIPKINILSRMARVDPFRIGIEPGAGR